MTPVPHLKKNLPPFTRQIPRSGRYGSAVGRLLQNRTLGKHTRVCLAGLDWRRPRPPQPRGPASLRSPRGPHPGDPRPAFARALPTPAKLGKLSRLRVVPCIPRPAPSPRAPGPQSPRLLAAHLRRGSPRPRPPARSRLANLGPSWGEGVDLGSVAGCPPPRAAALVGELGPPRPRGVPPGSVPTKCRRKRAEREVETSYHLGMLVVKCSPRLLVSS